MRVINIRSRQHKFPVGCQVVVIKEYLDKNVHLLLGYCGRVVGESIHNLPEFGLFNIRVIEVNFGIQIFSMNDKLAEEYLEQL